LGNQPVFTLLELIETLRPDIIKGGVWKEETSSARTPSAHGDGQVVIIPETEGASTTKIVAKGL